MKKLTTLLLAAGMVFAASAPASAVDVKMDGQYMFTFGMGETGFNGKNVDQAGQRLRLGMTFTASENLSGYLQLQAGIGADSTDYDWGTMNNAKTAIKVRQSYIDWVIPQTTVKVRMGKQLVGLPMDAMGKNAIMHPGVNSRDGIVVSSPVTDWLNVTAFWVRADYASDSYDTDTSKKSDYFAASAAMKFDGFAVTPYVMYGAIDRAAGVNGSSDADVNDVEGQGFWAGVTSSMTYFDPFVLKLSGAYGTIAYNDASDRSGWYMQAKASYKTAFGTPILAAWYGSGDDSDAKYAKQNWIPTNKGRFHPTINFNPNEFGLYDALSQHNISGTWGMQAGIEDVSFLDDLSHNFTVTWFKGTNSSKLAGAADPYKYMTASDNVVEFDFISTYKIYKNLTTVLELSYVISDFDKDDHGLVGDAYDKNDWRAALNFEYKF